MKLTSFFGAIVLCAAVAGCQTTKKAEHHAQLTVDAAWDGVKHCTGGKYRYYPSPRFRIDDIPSETKYLQFNLYHADENIDHGTDLVEYKGGSVIPPGVFKYLGPCPNPARLPGKYDWTVIALDQTQEVELGRGQTRLLFPR